MKIFKCWFYFLIFLLVSKTPAEEVELFTESSFSKPITKFILQNFNQNISSNLDLDSNPLLISGNNIASWKYGQNFRGCFYMNPKENIELRLAVLLWENFSSSRISTLNLSARKNIDSHSDINIIEPGIYRSVIGFEVEKIAPQKLKTVQMKTNGALNLSGQKVIVRLADSHRYYLSQNEISNSKEFVNSPSLLWNEVASNLSHVGDQSIPLAEDIDYIGVFFEKEIQEQIKSKEEHPLCFNSSITSLKYVKD